jgi:hypothetical protein
MNGEELFQLSKDTLDQFTNENESTRIHALLAQQKQLSGVRISFLLMMMIDSIFVSSTSINRKICLTNHRF